MGKSIPINLDGAFIDHNGNLVNRIVHHNESYGDASSIAQNISSLFRKHKTADTHYPVNMSSLWYPEYPRKEIQSFYDEQGVEVTIRGKTRVDLVPGEEGGKVYNHVISFPFRYIVYLYCNMYGDAKQTDIPRFMQSTKQELKATLTAVAKPKDTYINHDVYAMIGMHVVNIGS